ncbi:MAG TPA: family 78 glycoside hydrolase catalytic domain [Mycobacteriales bacterium]|nr:family 78 glycoside hydrolase catalytic domain [Mycobacteriales bacterium]
MSPLAVTACRTEYADRPLGVDVRRPHLSWLLDAGTSDATQTAYHVVVASDPALLPDRPDIWDSGVVRGDQSYGIRYAGPPLASRRRYFWAVQVSDAADRMSEWSAPTWWETALLDETDWQARWIGNPPTDNLLPLRYSDRDEPVRLAPGHSLGQSFTADVPATSISVCLMSWGAAGLRCTATLRRSGPDGAVVAEKNVDRIGDFFSWWLTPDSPLPPDIYYLELSEATADIGWWSHQKAAVPGGKAYADGVEVPGGRTISVETTAAPAPLLRTEFEVTPDIVSARLYATGLGYHELFLNGERIGEAVLDPATTNYQKTVLYNCYDVTGLLRTGANALGATLGRGFYGMREASVWAWNSAPWADEPKLLCQLEIVRADGSTKTVVSDDGWRIVDGPTRSDATYCGDLYDSTVEPVGWKSAGFDDGAWRPAATVAAPTGALRVQAMPPITVAGAIEPVAVDTRPDGSRVYDFGRVTAGWTTLRATGERGAAISLRYGEKLRESGDVDNDNWHVDGETQSDCYVLSGTGEETWQPSFGYKGFRYVQTTAVGDIAQESLLAHPVHTAVAPAGEFFCSDELLNWIDRATGDTVLNNLQGIPTDTPFFEKNGWTADAHLIAESAIHRFDMHRFFRKWLGDFRDAQFDDGGIPVIVPTSGWGAFTDPSWTDAYPLIAWNLYEFYGDLDVLAEHYEPLRRYTERLRDVCRTSGWLWPLFSHADWLPPGYTLAPEGPKVAGSVFVQVAARKMSDIARLLGRAGDAERYATFADDVTQAFNDAFLDKETGTYNSDIEAGYRQASNVLPLAFGMVPDDQVDAVVERLVRDVRDDHSGHLNTGALATKYLLPVLSAHGHADLALTVALQRTHPSWGFWRDQGAETLWEAWDADARSHDHYFLGTATQWLHEDIAGLRPGAPGFAEIEVRPVCLDDPRLTHASARYSSVRGEIAVSWRTSDGRVELDVTVPVGARARVHLPGPISGAVAAPAGPVTVGPGTHRLIGRL